MRIATARRGAYAEAKAEGVVTRFINVDPQNNCMRMISHVSGTSKGRGMTWSISDRSWAETWRVMSFNAEGGNLRRSMIILRLPEFLDDERERGLGWQAFAAVLLAIRRISLLRKHRYRCRTERCSWALCGGASSGAVGLSPMRLVVYSCVYGSWRWCSGWCVLLLWLILGSAAFAKLGTVLPAVITDSEKTFLKCTGFADIRICFSAVGQLWSEDFGAQFGASFTADGFNSSETFFHERVSELLWMVLLVVI